MITSLIALEEDVLDEIFEQPTKATQKQSFQVSLLSLKSSG